MKIKIICVGTIKNQNLNYLIKDYLKKIKYHTDVEIIEIKEELILNEDNVSEINLSLSKESMKIKKHLKKDDLVFILDLNGKQYDSLEFSSLINRSFNNSIYKNLVFVIGSSNGIDANFKKEINNSISFSKMTFPHQLFRLLLIEQIYRSLTIIKNVKYHK